MSAKKGKRCTNHGRALLHWVIDRQPPRVRIAMTPEEVRKWIAEVDAVTEAWSKTK